MLGSAPSATPVVRVRPDSAAAPSVRPCRPRPLNRRALPEQRSRLLAAPRTGRPGRGGADVAGRGRRARRRLAVLCKGSLRYINGMAFTAWLRGSTAPRLGYTGSTRLAARTLPLRPRGHPGLGWALRAVSRPLEAPGPDQPCEPSRSRAAASRDHRGERQARACFDVAGGRSRRLLGGNRACQRRYPPAPPAPLGHSDAVDPEKARAAARPRPAVRAADRASGPADGPATLLPQRARHERHRISHARASARPRAFGQARAARRAC